MVRMFRGLDWKFGLQIMCDGTLDCLIRDELRMGFWFLGIWLDDVSDLARQCVWLVEDGVGGLEVGGF